MVGDARGDVKGLSIDVRVSTDHCQYEGIVDHDYMDVVRVLGNPIGVGDGEQDEIEPFVPYESWWDIRCEDGIGNSVTISDFMVSDGSTISVATEGRFVTLGLR